MSRPRHDLTWKHIRRYWASPPKMSPHLSKLADKKYHQSPTAPLLNHISEQTSNHVKHSRTEYLVLPNNHIKQRADSLLELSEPPPVSKIYRSDPCPDLSKALRCTDLEVIRSELQMIISQLSTLTQHTRDQAESDDQAQDWKFVAMVVDRLCLILFTSSMIIFTILTLFSTPNFFKLR